MPLAFALACAMAGGAGAAWIAAGAAGAGSRALAWSALAASGVACAAAVALAAFALLRGARSAPAAAARWWCMLAACAATGAALAATSAIRDAALREARARDPPALREGPVTLRGVVASAPRLDGAGADALAGFARQDACIVFELEVEEAESRGECAALDAAVLVRVQEVGDFPPRGSPVRVRGWYRPSRPSSNPGARGGRGDGSVVVPRRSLVQALPESLPSRAVDAPLRAMRARADAALAAAMPAWSTRAARALSVAMTTGVRKPGLEEPAADFRAAGMSHVLAISGFNVAVLVAFAGGALAMLGVPTRPRATVAIGVALLFLAATEPEVSVLRAGLGAGLAAAASLRGGRARGLGTLGVVAGVTMLLDIDSLASPGFQLSYGVVVALLVLAGPAAARWDARATRLWEAIVPGRWRASEVAALVRGGLVEACVSGVVAWSVSTPIALWHGGFASLYSAPLSVLTMPLAAIVTVAGVGAMLAAPVSAAAAAWCGAASAGCAQGLAWMAHEAARAPGACWWTGRPALWWVAIALLASIGAWSARRAWVRRGAWAALVPIALLLWFGAALPMAGAPPPRTLRVDTLDMGNGACHLVRADGGALVFDAGSSSDDGAGSRRIVPSLAALGVRRLDALLLSHPSLEHCSGVPELLRAIEVRRIVMAAPLARRIAAAREGALAALRRAIEASGVPVETLSAGSELQLPGLRVEVLQPPTAQRGPTPGEESLAVRIHAAEAPARRAALLLCSDVEGGAVERLLALPEAPIAAAMELPHHGTWREETVQLLERVAPAVVLQSTGPQRIQRDRWSGALRGVRRGVTARDGALRCEIGPQGRVTLWRLREGAWEQRE
ncbi:MAG: ComEC/Rec2 family competence protein [Phycisphaerales bacterium]